MGLIFYSTVFAAPQDPHAHPLTWDKRYELFIHRAGFLPLAWLVTTRGLPLMDSVALTTLVDMWRPETHMFHLRVARPR
jgi:hypothetical protein